MKHPPTNIEEHRLTPSFQKVHKEDKVDSHFGLDHTTDLIENGFGLYSSAGLKMKIGPIKSAFYRFGLVTKGNVHLHCGLEHFEVSAGHAVFTYPGQVFSLFDKSDDFSAYYLFFTEEFIADALSLRGIQEQFGFLNYNGIQSFALQDNDLASIIDFIDKMDGEIQTRKRDIRQFLQLYIHLLLLQANRSYEQLKTKPLEGASTEKQLVGRYLKLVARHFGDKRKVADYAEMLHVSPDHLNKTAKAQTGKTAHRLIEEMVLLEAKAQLRHSQLSISEISFLLNFSDPPHFNKFFKKLTGTTPLQFRGKR